MSFRKKLNKLTAFNQAIIYAIQPEVVEDFKNPFRVIQQHDDALEAYLYLQDVLPTLTGNLHQQLTPKMLLEIISQIHARSAKSLIAHTQIRRPVQMEAGEYTYVPVIRWKTGCDLRDLVATYFAVDDMFPSSEHLVQMLNHKIDLYGKMIQEAKKNNMSPKGITALMEMLLQIQNEPHNYPYPESQDDNLEKITIDRRLIKSAKLFCALSYNIHRFTPDQQRAAARFAAIPVVPEYLQGAMLGFARRTCEAWKQVDASDQNAVIQLITNTFYELTKIHPFPNGNGRTATALINLMLVTLGYPSILMRLPGDRDNPSSLYARAIETIDEDRTLLVKHFRERFADPGFSDPDMKDVCCLRYGIMQNIDSINQRHPGYHAILVELINTISNFYVQACPGAKEIDAVRFIENILHYFATGQNKPLNNSKYQPGLFSVGGMVERQEKLKEGVIDYVEKKLNVSPANKLNP